MTPNDKVPMTELEQVQVALRDIVSLANRLTLKVIVLEATIAEIVVAMPADKRKVFARTFKVRISDLMQQHADRLLPSDDAEIASAVGNVLRAANSA
jgi:hypothetical protein